LSLYEDLWRPRALSKPPPIELKLSEVICAGPIFEKIKEPINNLTKIGFMINPNHQGSRLEHKIPEQAFKEPKYTNTDRVATYAVVKSKKPGLQPDQESRAICNQIQRRISYQNRVALRIKAR
jgi:hypothetical protein